MQAVHPGVVLAEKLVASKLSASALARALNVPPNRVTAILHGTRRVSADTALRLAHCLKTTPEFWLNLQIAYDLSLAIKEKGKRIAREVS